MPCSGQVEKRVEAAGVIVRLHKLIYKFTDDVTDLLHDIKLKEAKARGETKSKEIVGQANIMQTFNVTSTKGKKEATVFGSRVFEGELTAKAKYQVVRDDEVIMENLNLSSLRHLKSTVQKIDKGNECGVVFDHAKDLDFLRGDIIQCYVEKENDTEKFLHKPGVSKSF